MKSRFHLFLLPALIAVFNLIPAGWAEALDKSAEAVVVEDALAGLRGVVVRHVNNTLEARIDLGDGADGVSKSSGSVCTGNGQE